MAFIIKDRVKEGTTSTGTGAVSLGGAAATFNTFQSYMTNGDTTYYAIVHTTSGTDEWEVGLGTWNTGNTLTRTTVLAGSNGSSAVNFSTGTKDVFMTYPAAHAALAGDDVNFANITVTGTVDGRDVAADGTKLDTVEQNADVTDAVNVAAAGALMKSGGTMTGNLILNADPTTALGAATKEYVDTIASAGIHYHDPVRVESPSALTVTYNNGSSGVGATLTNAGTQAAITIDGVALSLNDRVLIYKQTDQTQNGVYTVTTVGDGSTNWVLTRATDADSYGASDPDSFGKGDAFFVKEGNTGAGELYVMTTAGTITFGTTNIVFSQVAETAVYNAGTGITLTGTTFSIGQDVATSSNVTFNQVTAAIIGNVTGNLTGDVTGNADTATALETARTIQLSGDVTGSASFDGTANINITAAVQDDSHAHVISNVDGLQTALDGKVPTTRTITSGNGLTGGGDLSANRTLAVGAGTGVTVNADNVAIGQDVATTANVTFNNITVTGTVDGRDVSADGSKLDGIESGATADQTITAGSGLTGGGTGNVTISHSDTSSQASVNNSGRTYIQDITLDGFGHVTGISSATETVTDTNTNQLTTFQLEDGDGTEVTISHGKEVKFVEAGGIDINWTDTSTGSDGDPYDMSFSINTGVTAGNGLTGGGTLNANRTLNVGAGSGITVSADAVAHSDTSTLSGTYGSTSDGTKIDQITVDGFGHITAITTGATGDIQGVTAGSGLTGGGTSGTVTVSHADTSSQASVNNSGRTYIQDITLDTYGHITGITSATETVTNTNTTSLPIENSAGTAQFTATDTTGLQFVGSGATSVAFDSTNKRVTISSTDTNTNTTYSAGSGLSLSGTTFSHSDTSSQASVNNSGRTYIQDITLDTYGHITGITSATETVTNTDTTYSAGAGLDLSGTTFSIESDVREHANQYFGGSGGEYIYFDNSNALMRFYINSGEEMRLESDGDLHVDGNVTAYSTTVSDERLKTDIERIDGALDKVCALSGYTFTYKHDGKASAGVVAQEVEKVLPSAVIEKELAFQGEAGQEYKIVQYDQLHGLLIEAIKELKAEIEELKNGSAN